MRPTRSTSTARPTPCLSSSTISPNDIRNCCSSPRSNFPQAVDSAFTSRCDLVMQIPLPDREACGRILTDCLTGLGKHLSEHSASCVATPHFDRCAAECVGLDGRAIRKMVANALASTRQTAMNPSQVTDRGSSWRPRKPRRRTGPKERKNDDAPLPAARSAARRIAMPRRPGPLIVEPSDAGRRRQARNELLAVGGHCRAASSPIRPPRTCADRRHLRRPAHAHLLPL